MRKIKVEVDKNLVEHFAGDLLDMEGACFLNTYLLKGEIEPEDVKEYLGENWSWFVWFTDKGTLKNIGEAQEVERKILEKCPDFYYTIANYMNRKIEEAFKEMAEAITPDMGEEEIRDLVKEEIKVFGDDGCPYLTTDALVEDAVNHLKRLKEEV